MYGNGIRQAGRYRIRILNGCQFISKIHQHIISCSIMILEYMLHGLPMLDSEVRYQWTYYTNLITNMWMSAKHSVHKTSHSRCIRYFVQTLFFSYVLGQSFKEKVKPTIEGCEPFFASCIANFLIILSMYEAWDNASNLFFRSLNSRMPII